MAVLPRTARELKKKSKSIINNGGVLENEVVVDGVIEQRYWIDNTI